MACRGRGLCGAARLVAEVAGGAQVQHHCAQAQQVVHKYNTIMNERVMIRGWEKHYLMALAGCSVQLALLFLLFVIISNVMAHNACTRCYAVWLRGGTGDTLLTTVTHAVARYHGGEPGR